MCFLHLLDSSKAQARGAASLLGRHAARHGVPFGQFQVRPDLVFQFPVQASPARQRHQPLPHFANTHDDSRKRAELLQGTLDLLVLRTLAPGPAHGYAIAKAIERQSEDVLQVEQGSLYPALHRLIKRGWISAEEGVSENNRRAKFYRLTAKGRKQLHVEATRWEKLARAIANVLKPAGETTP